MQWLAQIGIVLLASLCSTCCDGDVFQEQCLVAGTCRQVINADGLPAVLWEGLDTDVVAQQVPVIDVSALMSPDLHSTARWDEAAEAVSRACEEWGFFQVLRKCHSLLYVGVCLLCCRAEHLTEHGS